MSARDTLLAAVQAALGRPMPEAAVIQEAAQRLLDDLPLARPALDGQDLQHLFAARVASPKVAATMEPIDHISDLPAAVARYLQAQQLPRELALQPADALKALDWQGFALHEAPALNEKVGVGLADAGIAETGSLVFHSGPQTPVLAHFLPLHHIVLLRASTLYRYLDDYAAAVLHAGSPPSRNINIITGASGTTDIEGSLVLGAHGPCNLHVVMVRDGSPV